MRMATRMQRDGCQLHESLLPGVSEHRKQNVWTVC